MSSPASVAFDLIPAAVAAAKTLVPKDVQVFNGYGVTNDPSDFVQIGVMDPFSTSAAVAIETGHEFAYANTTTADETGHINCVAFTRNGDGNPDLAWARLQQVLDPIALHLRSNYTLGVDGVMWVRFSLTQADHDQDDAGAWAIASFRLNFRARI